VAKASSKTWAPPWSLSVTNLYTNRDKPKVRDDALLVETKQQTNTCRIRRVSSSHVTER